MRHAFVTLFALLLSAQPAAQAADAPRQTDGRLIAEQWTLFEYSFASERKYDNPFVDIQVDVVFQRGEQHWNVPAFWAGNDTWTVRFAPPLQGIYSFRVACSDRKNEALNGAALALHVTPYTGDNPLLKHGFLRIASDNRHFEHADGTPFWPALEILIQAICQAR